MTDSIQVDEVFDRVLVSITKVLTGLEMQREEPEAWSAAEAFAETIYTNGNFEAYLLFEIDQKLFEYIVATMHGGSPPQRDEKILYMNEYTNIICGRAVSIINNATGYASRLSIPTFHQSLDEVEEEETDGAEQKILLYETEKGFLRIVIRYTFR